MHPEGAPNPQQQCNATLHDDLHVATVAGTSSGHMSRKVLGAVTRALERTPRLAHV